jgi:hypothetical protein
MRFFWRTNATLLAGHKAWLNRVDAKNLKAGTSAPSLAAAWSGPADLFGALALNPRLADLTLESATVEGRASFDAYGGNVRNHDLVLRAANADGEPIVVCVEAKAGEPLGATVAEQARAAGNAKLKNPNSKAATRLTELVERLSRYPIDDARVASLRYQLLTAWAGTLADATDAAHAVLAVHEFRTDQRPEDKSVLNGAELARFADVVLGCELPTPQDPPWCVRVPDVGGTQAALYVAHVLTDLRGEAVAAFAS